MMRLIHSLANLPPAFQGGVVTIGNFDGVHLGHQQLLATVVAKAKVLGVPALVVTFEPQPYEFFAGSQEGAARLSRLREKFTAITACGIDGLVILRFNQQLASLTASDFLNIVIGKHLCPQHIVVGDDFRFGYKRQGDFAMLQTAGKQLGFSVEAMPTFLVAGERVSSTRVRQALAVGDHELASQLLGHPYCMQGRVCHGDKLGRQLGFPTANIHLHRKRTPVHGVYTVYMHGLTDKPLPGVANVGERPTIDGTRTLLEVHLLAFNQDIYGRYVTVEFCEKLREEERYSSLESLQEQIAKDVAVAKEYFQQ